MIIKKDKIMVAATCYLDFKGSEDLKEWFVINQSFVSPYVADSSSKDKSQDDMS